jgi:hypothetical protein
LCTPLESFNRQHSLHVLGIKHEQKSYPNAAYPAPNSIQPTRGFEKGSATSLKHFHSDDVAAFAFAQVAGAVAAEFALVVDDDGVGSVVSDDIVDAMV